MGCVNSHLLTHDDEIAQLSSAALGHHIVKLTSTTYGLLNLDPPPPPQPQPSPTTPPVPLGRFPEPEVINSWELMDGLDAESFRFPTPQQKPITPKASKLEKENSNPNIILSNSLFAFKEIAQKPSPVNNLMEKFEKLCPPGGENRVVIYTTSLRGVRKTFEDCNAVRSTIQAFGVAICERDVSMHSGFKEELRELLKSKGSDALVLPRVFVKGRYLGGAEDVLRLVEDSYFGDLISGLPKKQAGDVCDGCGDARFLPCFRCNGSCKIVGRSVVMKCDECNENGLVVCPICS